MNKNIFRSVALTVGSIWDRRQGLFIFLKLWPCWKTQNCLQILYSSVGSGLQSTSYVSKWARKEAHKTTCKHWTLSSPYSMLTECDLCCSINSWLVPIEELAVSKSSLLSCSSVMTFSCWQTYCWRIMRLMLMSEEFTCVSQKPASESTCDAAVCVLSSIPSAWSLLSHLLLAAFASASCVSSLHCQWSLAV